MSLKRCYSFDHLPFVKDEKTMEPIRPVSDEEIVLFMRMTGLHCYDVFYEPNSPLNRLSPIYYLYHVDRIQKDLKQDYGLDSIWPLSVVNIEKTIKNLLDETRKSLPSKCQEEEEEVVVFVEAVFGGYQEEIINKENDNDEDVIHQVTQSKVAKKRKNIDTAQPMVEKHAQSLFEISTIMALDEQEENNDEDATQPAKRVLKTPIGVEKQAQSKIEITQLNDNRKLAALESRFY